MTVDPRLHDTDQTVELLRRARGGDRAALDDLLTRHRERLRRMVDLRMADALRRRVDASDVVQEALIEAAQRLPDFVAARDAHETPMSFFLWLRWLTRERLVTLHRRHAGTRARDPAREVPIDQHLLPEATSEGLAAQLLGRLTSPSLALERAEMRRRLQEVLDTLEPKEREVIALRHFEQLSNAEAARELGIGEAAASKRYIRALARMQGLLTSCGLAPDPPPPA